MENIIIGIIGITLGFCAGYILGARREAEKHRQCHRRQRAIADTLTRDLKIGMDFAKGPSAAVAFEAKVEKGEIVSMRPVKLPKDFGKMKDEVETTPAVKTPEKKKRVSKPRTAAQKKQARDRMRIYRARKRGQA